MDLFLKGVLQGSIPVVVVVGGTNLLVKKFRESKPVLYWGSLAVATGVAIAVVQGRIPAPFMNAEDEEGMCAVCGDYDVIFAHTPQLGKLCEVCYEEMDEEGELETIYGAETFNAESGEIIYFIKQMDEDNEKGYFIGNEQYIRDSLDESYYHTMDRYYEDKEKYQKMMDSYETMSVAEICEELGLELVGAKSNGGYLTITGDDMKNYFDAETFEAMTMKDGIIVCDSCNNDVESDSQYGELKIVCNNCGHTLYEDDSYGSFDVGDYYGAESKTIFGKDKNGKMYARRRNGRIITHNAESFNAEKMSPCCEEPLIEREGIFCEACGENYGFSAETFNSERIHGDERLDRWVENNYGDDYDWALLNEYDESDDAYDILEDFIVLDDDGNEHKGIAIIYRDD